MGCQTQGTSVLWQWKCHKHLFIYSAHNGTVSRSFCFQSLLIPSCYPSSPLLFLSNCEMVIYFQWQAPLANKLLGSISVSRFFSLNLSPSLRIRQQQHHLKLGRLSVEFSWSWEQLLSPDDFMSTGNSWSGTWGDSIAWTHSLRILL